MHAILAGHHATLTDTIAFAEEKYRDVFNGRLFLEQLLDLSNVEDEPIASLGSKISRRALSTFFEHAVREYRP